MNAYLTFDDSLVWLAMTAGLLSLCMFVLWRAYRRDRTANAAGRPAPKFALALKAVAFAMLVLCLLDPSWSGVRATPGANRLVFLVDDSRSMSIADEANGDTRGDVAVKLLDRERSPWLLGLDRNFDVRTRAFGSRPRALAEGESLAFADDASNLAKALAAQRAYAGESPVAGIVLLTDGNATDAAALAGLDLSSMPPIHPVALGGREPLPDLAVRHVGVTRSAFEDAPVTIRADIAARGLAGREIVVELVDESGAVIRHETRTIDGEWETVACEFRIGHGGDRPRFFQVRASVQSTAEAGEPFVEATRANNVRTVVVERTAGPHRILYLAGRPNWEFKFLNRAIDEDDELDLVALVRIARQTPKLQWRGRDGDGNRLFRNFDDTPESERERADEPVLVRLNTRDARELAHGFPAQADELFAFDAVILDDLEASFFSYDQLALLRRFVAERGGSLLMLGGPRTFTGGGWDRTALAEALPVNFDRRDAADSSGVEPQRLALTREGLLQPWVRLRATADDERARIAEMPGFRVVSTTGAVRPGATTLAETVDATGRHSPALVVHRYGHGRCAALAIGDLWRWRLQREEESDDDDLGRMWRQTLRWLVADVPERVRIEITGGGAGFPACRFAVAGEVRADKDVHPTGSERTASPSYDGVSVRVHVRDGEHRPLDGGTVRVTIEPAEGAPLELLAEPSLAQPGMYEVEYRPRGAGAYRVRVVATDGDGNEVGTDETGWAHEPNAAEFARLEPDRELLRELDERTGGRLLSPDDLPAFARGLPTTDVPTTERVTTPLWHRPWVFLLILGCLAGEWGLRRRKGLR